MSTGDLHNFNEAGAGTSNLRILLIFYGHWFLLLSHEHTVLFWFDFEDELAADNVRNYDKDVTRW